MVRVLCTVTVTEDAHRGASSGDEVAYVGGARSSCVQDATRLLAPASRRQRDRSTGIEFLRPLFREAQELARRRNTLTHTGEMPEDVVVSK